MRYGSLEYAYAEPFANALVTDSAFRSWILEQTKFAAYASNASVLHDEMKARRSRIATNWWRSHFTEKCRCEGCRGQETDLLAIFEGASNLRFALHIEVKQPKDKFPRKTDQATNYSIRAKCWAHASPRNVLPHSDAATILLFSALKRNEYNEEINKFDTAITFEEISKNFSHATCAQK